jgi:hypothetical protein
MNVEYAFLCDYADSGNKLTAVGIGIDSIYATAVPAVHPQLFTVLALKFAPNETQRERTLELHVQDADANDIIPPLADKINIKEPAEGMNYRTHRIINGLYGIQLEKFGDYQVSWLVDGTEVHALHFRVAKKP